jgi:ureidoglycolate lyase
MILTEPLSHDTFAPFGDVLDTSGDPDRLINAGLCGRWHDRARLDFGPGGRAGISLFRSETRQFPYALDLLERHPLGSQTFLPMTQDPFLVIVAEDDAGTPARIRAFLTAPGQGINLLRNTWHGVLTPLAPPGLFAVVDRIGEGPNLQEYRLPAPLIVTRAPA